MLAGSLFLSVTHVLDVESNSLLDPFSDSRPRLGPASQHSPFTMSVVRGQAGPSYHSIMEGKNRWRVPELGSLPEAPSSDYNIGEMLLKIRVVGRCAGAMHKILGHLDHWEPYRFAKKTSTTRSPRRRGRARSPECRCVAYMSTVLNFRTTSDAAPSPPPAGCRPSGTSLKLR